MTVTKLRFFRNTPTPDDFDPEAHEWLVRASPTEYLFVLKPSDRWTRPPDLSRKTEVPVEQVPAEIRRKAGQRLGAYRRNGRRPGDPT